MTEQLRVEACSICKPWLERKVRYEPQRVSEYVIAARYIRKIVTDRCSGSDYLYCQDRLQQPA